MFTEVEAALIRAALKMAQERQTAAFGVSDPAFGELLNKMDKPVEEAAPEAEPEAKPAKKSKK